MSQTGLEHHVAAKSALLRRTSPRGLARHALEQAVGFPLDAAVVSTSEHAAPFNLLSTTSFALPQMALNVHGIGEAATPLILAGSLVPLDNSHYPRGFLRPSGGRSNLHPQRRRKAVAGLCPPVPGPPPGDLLEDYPFLRPAFERAHPSYAHQLADCMELIAAAWLPGRVEVRPLELVARTVLEQVLDSDDVLDRVLFDAPSRQRLARELRGVFCAWTATRGTFLFWHCDGSKVRRLVEQDGALVGEGVRVELRRDDVAAALRDGVLLPGVLLSLLAVSYLPGVPIAGGPKQLTYWAAMIAAFDRLGLGPGGEELSVFAYMSVDLAALHLTPRGEHPPQRGTGLALADAPLDAAWLCDQLERLLADEPPQRLALYG